MYALHFGAYSPTLPPRPFRRTLLPRSLPLIPSTRALTTRGTWRPTHAVSLPESRLFPYVFCPLFRFLFRPTSQHPASISASPLSLFSFFLITPFYLFRVSPPKSRLPTTNHTRTARRFLYTADTAGASSLTTCTLSTALYGRAVPYHRVFRPHRCTRVFSGRYLQRTATDGDVQNTLRTYVFVGYRGIVSKLTTVFRNFPSAIYANTTTKRLTGFRRADDTITRARL